jgi:hypothetical protein
MAIKNSCLVAAAVLLCSTAAFAQSDKPQFVKTGSGDTEYKWQHGRDSPRSAADTGAIAYLDYLPAVGFLIVGLGLTERLRERHRENAWRRVQVEAADVAMTRQTLDDVTPSFNPITPEQMLAFSRPRCQLEDSTLQVELADVMAVRRTV